ncbi:hypothetical protein [Streptomyces cavernicola]|uniref:Guanylate cyclase domain-containing protein n=1 Tax=Streptomyces cavernicola TaxID=3043613 RepID=A0ABT6SKD3_9ACTN|nr:hypothetical protein [Streptomyces sp. B-S-A6]MDI3408524.1 hypothetical protein [Streptomyces sp. B-S-A6]
MTDPVYRTILLFDIEQYGSRDDVEQAYLRRILYDVVDGTLAAAAVDETARMRADRGDSVMELIDTRVSVSTLVKSLLTEAPAQLHSKNRLLATGAQMRLRIVLSSGYVAVDDLGGWVGSDLNHAVRLLNSDPLREALKQRGEDSVLCVSEAVYQGVVRHGPLGVRAEDFRPVPVETKEGPTVAWVHGLPDPDLQKPAEPADPSALTEASEPSDSSGPAVPGAQAAPGAPAGQGGPLINGGQYGIAGGDNRGDLTFNFGERGNGGRA